ncbi:tetratricopeptide repeat protein [Streptomyces roseolus]|uniref:tetratricopeptide repeat protein n=1 Tax=Streptomyces roseolus TaxID=67358 RepID=UPI0037B6DF43
MSEQHSQVSGNARSYQAGHSIHITETAAPAPQALASLPAAPHLTGREEPTAALLKALGPEGSGATVVTGLPGVGKTALALHAAHQAVTLGHFPGGTLFVHLRGYDPAGAVAPEQALEALLRALGVRDDDLPPTPEEQAGLYRSLLSGRAEEHGPMLIVADDASSSSQLLPLIPAHSTHRLLSTSRDTLTAPDLRPRLIPLDELTPDAAAALITSALTQTRPDDPRPRADPEALARVVTHCGRLPLALTIAAALLTDDPGLPVATLAEDLADTRTRLQTLRHEDATGRSLAVRTAFDLSYRRLRDQDARLFRLLPLNPGPDLSTEAAATLVDLPPRETRASLAALARACLITEHPVGSGRWRLHDLIRLYASELPQEEDRHEAAGRLMIGHYYRICDAADDHLRAVPGKPLPDHFTGPGEALAWLDAERANLIAMVHLTTETAPAVAPYMSASLGTYLHRRRHFHDAVAVNGSALAATRKLDDRRGEAFALRNLGESLQYLRRFEEASTNLTQAAAIYHELNEPRAEGVALGTLGDTLVDLRRFDEAITTLEQAAALFRSIGERLDEGIALGTLATALVETGRPVEGISTLTQVIDIYRERNDRHGEAVALSNLGIALREAGRFDDAVIAHRQSLVLLRDLDDPQNRGAALNMYGAALQHVDRLDEAITAHREALAVLTKLEDHHGMGGALSNLGGALARTGSLDQASAAFAAAVAIFRELGDEYSEGLAQRNLEQVQRERTTKRPWWPFGRRRARRTEA